MFDFFTPKNKKSPIDKSSSSSMSMDESDAADISANIGELNAQDRSELKAFIQAETQRAGIQASVHTLTDMCFEKCISPESSSTLATLTASEDSCLQACVHRFLESSRLIVEHMQSMRK